MANEIAEVLMLVPMIAETGKMIVSPTAQLELLMLPIVATTLKLPVLPPVTVIEPLAELTVAGQPPVRVTV